MCRRAGENSSGESRAVSRGVAHVWRGQTGFHAREILHSEGDETLAIEVAVERAFPQPSSQRLSKRTRAPRRTGRRVTHDLRRPHIELKMQGTEPVLANRGRLEVARHMARDTGEDEPDNLVVDAARTAGHRRG